MCQKADVDLFACEANYHKSCRRDYLEIKISEQARMKKLERNKKSLKKHMHWHSAHALAFSKIREIIDQEVILAKNILKLSKLHEKYVEYIAKTRFPNPAYQGEKLKSKLEKFEEYIGIISFTQLESKGKFESCLMYNKTIKLDSASWHVLEAIHPKRF